MAYKSWNVGDTLTAADMNTYVRDQTITVCTSAGRPGSPATGKMIYETDTNRLLVWNGSYWKPVASGGPSKSYTPQFYVSGGSLSYAWNYGGYYKFGMQIIGWSSTKINTRTGGSTPEYLLTPDGHLSRVEGDYVFTKPLATFVYRPISTGSFYGGYVVVGDIGTPYCRLISDTGGTGPWSTWNPGFAANDIIHINWSFETSSE